MWGKRTIGRLLEGIAPRPERTPQRRHNPDAVVDCAVYTGGTRGTGTKHYAEAAKEARRHRDAFLWLGLHEPDRATMTAVARVFGLHELIVEQTAGSGHRPALETIGDVTRLVLRTARYVEHDALTETTEVVDTGDVTVLIGPWFVITVRNGGAGALWPVRQDMENRPTVLQQGPWSVAYAITSRMVDEYLGVAAAVERDLERLEEETFTTERTPEIAHFYQLKREMVEFKRAVLPLAEPIDQLLDQPAAPASLRPYFVDVRGRLARATDRISAFDDLLNSILQARLAQVSLDQNNDMRMIAAWAAIAAVPTVIAGVYGMNFSHIPGLGSPYGFAVTIAVIVVICGTLYWRLRRGGWLR
ncbi:magnesium and cobalt transport protein CorA [Actinoplanes sp. TBRC 11911]|uniref:magnesium and cobalt transport protein CorA n=1 Tax=Actinoplanes sp. TBRC 11911 TaxID=2729386 RepID=UPI00145FC136|nr:magnesium and cobalt transport protein CorA [Actinoplanes sp. TBRC 11911]NMO50707.1 magnesium and cobalt transport protein CorA [Actinoplanes sp. TBRC 11911]